MAKKAKRGRPKAEQPLNKRYFRIADEDWERIVTAVGQGNVGAWIRETLIRAARRLRSRSPDGRT